MMTPSSYGLEYICSRLDTIGKGTRYTAKATKIFFLQNNGPEILLTGKGNARGNQPAPIDPPFLPQ
jgi:hypothetical protein